VQGFAVDEPYADGESFCTQRSRQTVEQIQKLGVRLTRFARRQHPGIVFARRFDIAYQQLDRGIEGVRQQRGFVDRGLPAGRAGIDDD